MTKRVRIVCDCCEDDSGTTEFIERAARYLNKTTDEIHEELWDGKWLITGAHAEKVEEVAGS